MVETIDLDGAAISNGHSLSVHEFVLDAVANDELGAFEPGDGGWWSAIDLADQLDRPIGTTLHEQLLDGGGLSCKR